METSLLDTLSSETSSLETLLLDFFVRDFVDGDLVVGDFVGDFVVQGLLSEALSSETLGSETLPSEALSLSSEPSSSETSFLSSKTLLSETSLLETSSSETSSELSWRPGRCSLFYYWASVRSLQYSSLRYHPPLRRWDVALAATAKLISGFEGGICPLASGQGGIASWIDAAPLSHNSVICFLHLNGWTTLGDLKKP